jgi:hypothetical protein
LIACAGYTDNSAGSSIVNRGVQCCGERTEKWQADDGRVRAALRHNVVGSPRYGTDNGGCSRRTASESLDGKKVG